MTHQEERRKRAAMFPLSVAECAAQAKAYREMYKLAWRVSDLDVCKIINERIHVLKLKMANAVEAQEQKFLTHAPPPSAIIMEADAIIGADKRSRDNE